MRCGECGQENPERAKFCSECGTPLAEAEPRQSRESRRTVTVVFADMVGFTSLGESLDQESLRRVMDRFYAEMRGAIEAQDGTLAKFIGDAVLAVWGTPEVREDDALRAVRAADAMRLALAGLNEDLHERWGVRVGMRTGVNTGEVVVDPDRPADLLVGDTLNVAARLEQAAGDGEVLVGPETYRLVRDDTVLEPVEPLALKGKAKPMPAWRVVDTVRDDRRGSDRLQAPLVGRTAEVAALRSALDTVVATRSCRMTTVIGSPGLGKTRLVDEFAASVGDEAIVLHGRCQATGEGITFQPVAEVLRGAAGIDDDDGPEEARAKLGTVLPESEPDRDRVIERAASLLGLAPAGSTEETFWAVRRILEGLSRERPVVLVHDDIHWGQPTFLDLLEHFVTWIRDAPVFVLALARPELREVRPGLAEESGLIEVISLQPLDAAASRAMVSGLLGAADLPEGLALRVLETTEGNPLFLGEMLRMLADEGVLRREGDSWVAGDLSGVTVPPTINALLSARIQRLDADERSVVERAAVIGHAFYRGAVCELAPAPVRPQVDDALLTLTRKEMVRAEDEWWLDEQVFRFHHVLIRDAAYRSLLKEARAELHERFAAWLEAKAGELAGEHEEVIAFHLEQAHAYRLELGPLDESGRDLAARAGRRLHSAGCRALAREDLPAAANLLSRALFPLAANPALRMEALVDLAETLVSAGDTGAAEEVVEELGLGADELGDDRLRARAVVFAAQLDNLTGAGQVRDTADLAGTAAETLAASGDRAGEAKAHQVVAQSEALLGQVAAAEAALDRALVAARAADDRRRITAVLSGAPRAALWGPAPIVRASGRCLDVVRILRMTPGNRHVEAAALRSQAVLEAMRGRAEAARGILGTCRVTLEELGLTVELHETAVHAGIVELLAADPAAAEHHLRAAQEGFHALGIESGAAQAAALLARALLAQDRDEDALEATRFAERHGGEDLKTTATWLGVRAEVLSGRGEHDEARELARRAVALTEPTDALADKADALMALAAVEAQAGDEQAAREAAVHARELYTAKDHSVGVALAEVLAGAAAPAPGAAPAVPAAGHDGGPAARALQRLVTCLNEADWDGLHTLFGAAGFRWIDRRSAGFFDEEGRAELDAAAAVRSISTVPEGSSWTFELLADGGDVAAGRMSSRGTGRKAGPWEVVAGTVCVCRGDKPVLWEALEDDRSNILARFEELSGVAKPAVARRRRYIELSAQRLDELAAHHGFTHAFQRAINERDFDALRQMLAEDFRQEDRRAVGAEAVESAEALVTTMVTAVSAVPDVQLRADVVAVAGDRNVTRFWWTGHDAYGGGPFELEVWGMGLLAERGAVSMYLYDSEQEARELLERLDSGAGGAPANLAGEVPEARARDWMAAQRWHDAFAAAFNARDYDAIAALHQPDAVQQDHRRVVSAGPLDVEAFVQALRQAVELVPDSRVEARPVAVDGPRSQSTIEYTGALGDGDGGEMQLTFHTIGELRDGLLASSATYDTADDARAAFAAGASSQAEEALTGLQETDAAAGSGSAGPSRPAREAAQISIREAISAGEAPVLAYVRAAEAAFNARDWERLQALAAEDMVTVDHRPFGSGRQEAESGQLHALVDAIPDATWHHELLEVLAPDRALVRLLLRGAGADGGPVEIDLVRVVRLDAEGRYVRGDVFEDEPAARAWLATDTASPVARMFATVQRAVNEGDWDAYAEVIREDYRWIDLRSGLRFDADAREEFVEAMRTSRESKELHWYLAHLDERADGRVGMARIQQTRSVRGGPCEITFLVISVMDDEGRAYSVETFADGDPAASERLEELAAHHEICIRGQDAVNRGDFDALRKLVAEDFRQEDRRSISDDPIAGPDAFVAVLRAVVGAVPDARLSMEVVAVAGDRQLTRHRWSGRGLDGQGGAAEFEYWAVATITGGLMIRSDLYESEEDARAALAASVAAMYDALVAAFNARDWDRLAALNHPDFELRDHRSMLRGETLRHGEMVESFRRTAGDGDLRWEVLGRIATGERAEIVLGRWSGTAAGASFEVEFLDVHCLAGDGRLLVSHTFAVEQEDEARECFDALAASGS